MNNICSYTDNNDLIRQHKNGNKDAYTKLIQNNQRLVSSIASRFIGRGQEYEDLIEIGKMGLLKAIEGFDESLGYSFSTYAFPFISGEIKRFLRDDGIIKVSRDTKRNAVTVLKAKQEYIKAHGKSPSLSELSTLCGLSTDKIIYALEASSPVMSLQEKTGDDDGTELCDTISSSDNISSLIERTALKQVISRLDVFDKKLIELRFYREFTQSETARILNISQVTVSRKEKAILKKLKEQLLV